jgi:hypothetical protein
MSWSAQRTSLREGAVRSPFSSRCHLKLQRTERADLAIPSSCIRAYGSSIVRNAAAACAMKNDIGRIAYISDVQDKSVRVCCDPREIPGVIVAELDHLPLPNCASNLSKTSRNPGSCVSSTWRWFHKPEPRTRARSDAFPSQPDDGGSSGARP